MLMLFQPLHQLLLRLLLTYRSFEFPLQQIRIKDVNVDNAHTMVRKTEVIQIKGCPVRELMELHLEVTTLNVNFIHKNLFHTMDFYEMKV